MPELVTTNKDGVITFENKKIKLIKQINSLRYSKIYQESITYTFPGDTEPDNIQMRDERDRQNIQDIIIDAMMREPTDIVYFMPQSNIIKTLTTQEIINMGQFLKNRSDNIVSYAWNLKEQVYNSSDIDSLPDIESGWPI